MKRIAVLAALMLASSAVLANRCPPEATLGKAKGILGIN